MQMLQCREPHSLPQTEYTEQDYNPVWSVEQLELPIIKFSREEWMAVIVALHIYFPSFESVVICFRSRDVVRAIIGRVRSTVFV
jgi:hypothetical protein